MNAETEAKLKQAIGVAVGQASMCWQHPEQAGIFQSDAAVIVVDELFKEVTGILRDEERA